MATLTRCFSSNWTYIRAAIILYLICLVCTLAWLNANRKQSLLWIADEWPRDSVQKLSQSDTSVKSFEIVKIIKPKSKVDTPMDKYVISLLNDSGKFCDGDFIGYGKVLAKLSNVVVNPKFGQGRQGGENITEVIKQQEDKEYYQLSNGYFNLKCSGNVGYNFVPKSHLSKWKTALKTVDVLPQASKRVSTWTMAIMRYEYANLYHTMTDFYNAFLTTKIYDLDPDETDVLWVDGHPMGALDTTWDVLFGHVTRVGDITEPVQYDNLVWNIMGYDSVMNNHHLPFIPYTEEFREFFLSRHGIVTDKPLHCQKLRVLFLWRRDYLAHPRNPSGHVSRKIKNEDELLSRAKELLPGHVIEGLQIDNLTMTRQLEVIANTDILIGMHGAGLTHTLFLPQHSGLIELFPTYWSSANRHFRAFSQWRKLRYSTWSNTDSKRELDGHYTVVDVDVVMKMLHEIHHKLCGDEADQH